MNFFKKTTISLLALFIVLTSATIVPKHPQPNAERLNSLVNSAKADGKITKKEMKSIAKTIKGSSLTWKEKIALSVFGKKVGNKIIANSGAKGSESGGKSQLVALLLCFLVGCIGIHRFYLGYTVEGILQLITFGGCGIWAFIDLIRICVGSLKPKDGEYEDTL